MIESNDEIVLALDNRIGDLNSRIERDTADLEALKRARAVLLRPIPTAGQPSLPGVSTFADLKPQAAVERVLHENPGQRFKASEMAQKIASLGVHKYGLNFTSIVIGALNRAAKKGIAVRDRLPNGRSVYSLRIGENK
jgi:hypothetical protein